VSCIHLETACPATAYQFVCLTACLTVSGFTSLASSLHSQSQTASLFRGSKKFSSPKGGGHSPMSHLSLRAWWRSPPPHAKKVGSSFVDNSLGEKKFLQTLRWENCLYNLNWYPLRLLPYHLEPMWKILMDNTSFTTDCFIRYDQVATFSSLLHGCKFKVLNMSVYDFSSDLWSI